MPRKGPKKLTARDCRYESRVQERRIQNIEDKKAESSAEELRKYDISSRPEMPSSSSERKALRRGLIERGDHLLRCGDNGVKRDDVMPKSELPTKRIERGLIDHNEF